MVVVPSAETSLGWSSVVHWSSLAQVVARALPLTRITDALEPDPATKPAPFTASVKLDAAPAITDDGRICSMVEPLVMATLAVED